MNFKAIKRGANAKGTIFAMVQYSDRSKYGVYKLCSNYCGNIKGGVRKSWRCVISKVSREEALALYERRLKGTQL